MHSEDTQYNIYVYISQRIENNTIDICCSSKNCIISTSPSFSLSLRYRPTGRWFIFSLLKCFPLKKHVSSVTVESVSISSAATSSPHVKLIPLYAWHLNSRYLLGASPPILRAISFPTFLDTLTGAGVPRTPDSASKIRIVDARARVRASAYGVRKKVVRNENHGIVRGETTITEDQGASWSY